MKLNQIKNFKDMDEYIDTVLTNHKSGKIDIEEANGRLYDLMINVQQATKKQMLLCEVQN